MNDEIQTADGNTTELANTPNPTGMAFANPMDIPDLDAVDAGMKIEQSYYEFKEEGQAVRGIYNGTKMVTVQRNGGQAQIPAVVFQNRDGVFLNSGASLVRQFEAIPPGTPVEIKFTGKERTNNGYDVNKFDVRILNVAVKVTQIQAPAPQPRLSAPKADQEIIEDGGAVQLYPFDGDVVVKLYAQSKNIPLAKAAQNLHAMRNAGQIGAALSIEEAASLE